MRPWRFTAGVLCAAILMSSVSAEAGTTIIPLPAIGVNRNDGVEVGNLTAFLMSDENGVVQAIIAPSITYNSVIGTNFVFRLFWYGTGDRDLSVIAGHSTGVDQEYTITFQDPSVWRSILALDGRVSFERDTRARFFGLGPESRSGDESNYTQNEFEWLASVGWNLTEQFRLALGQHLRVFGVNEGNVDTLPFTGSRFPGASGIQGSTVLSHRVSFMMDNRDDQTTPTRGRFGTVFVEFFNAFQDDRSMPFIRGGLEGGAVIPSLEGLLTTVAHARFEFGSQRDAPIFSQAHLGGDSTLRGFGDDRFIDRHLVLLNIEQRIRVWRANLFDVDTEWEIDPFIDVGKVFHKFDGFIDRVQVNPGVGFRALVRPNVVGRVDLALGREGLATFVGIDFPF